MDDPQNGPGGIISSTPPPRPKIQELPRLRSPTYRDLAEAYATAYADHRQHIEAIYSELDEMRIAIGLIDSRYARMLDELREAIREEIRTQMRIRPKSRSLSEYNPELTPAHGIRLDHDAWQRLQQHVEEQQEHLEQEKQKARDAEMRQKGAEDYVRQLTQRTEQANAESDRKLRNLKLKVGIAIAVASAITGTLVHVLHLLGH